MSHLFGYQNYETGENSRNNWFVAILTLGEGWHNNHHAHQRSACHGHKWWEFDPTYSTILLLRSVGLATDLRHPTTTGRLRPGSEETVGRCDYGPRLEVSSGEPRRRHAA